MRPSSSNLPKVGLVLSGEVVLEVAGEHPGAVFLGHAMFVADLDAEQARRGGVVFVGRDSNDK
jgi:hypothetical protein